MKGLFVKDFGYIKGSIAFILVIVAVMIFAMQGVTFIPPYMAVMSVSMLISTFNFDMAEGGMSFLLTLPVTRKMYVREKFLFTFALVFALMVVGAAMGMAVSLIKQTTVTAEAMIGALMAGAAIMMLMVSVSVPSIIKWGVEKGRYIATGAAAVAAAVIVGMAVWLGDTAFMAGWTPFAITLAFCAAVTVISYKTSLKLMERQEF